MIQPEEFLFRDLQHRLDLHSAFFSKKPFSFPFLLLFLHVSIQLQGDGCTRCSFYLFTLIKGSSTFFTCHFRHPSKKASLPSLSPCCLRSLSLSVCLWKQCHSVKLSLLTSVLWTSKTIFCLSCSIQNFLDLHLCSTLNQPPPHPALQSLFQLVVAMCYSMGRK